jgi:GNAT superfamily N-acetyltransferase
MLKSQDWRKDGYLISTDQTLIDLKAVHAYLSRAYWCEGIPFEIVEKSARNSLCFGLYQITDSGSRTQIGFARVISDYASFAYLADVYVLEEHRGQGLSKWLMSCIMRHPDLQGLRRFLLATKGAHGLYARYGFQITETPDYFMEIKKKSYK